MATKIRQEAVGREASVAFRALYYERRDARAGPGEERRGRQDDKANEQLGRRWRRGEEDGVPQDEEEDREPPREDADRRREAPESAAERAREGLRRPHSAVSEPEDQGAVRDCRSKVQL